MTELRIWRKNRGWTQARAARELGMARPRYQDLEIGRLTPTPHMWARLRAYFGDEKAEQIVRPVRSIV